MSKFDYGSSNAFGNSQEIATGNKGSYFWGKNILKFDGSLSDKQVLLKSISNFIRILTGKNIPVKYCTNGEDSSYTDGLEVTVSSFILPKNIDSTIGLGLHEGSHVAITDFKVIRDLMKKHNIDKKYYEYTKYIKGLHNWVEDRRIDYWAYHKAPGFKQYYVALYERYFMADEVGEVLVIKKDNLSLENAINYEFFIINSMHPDVTMTELKGLSEIKDLIDINNNPQIWKNTQDTLDVTLKIFDVIMKYVSPEEMEKVNNDNLPLTLNELKDILGEILSDIINTQRSFLEGDVPKKKLSNADAMKIEALIKSDTKIEELNDTEGKYEVLTVNKVDEATILSELYPIFKPLLKDLQVTLINQGISLGKKLGGQLKIRNEENTLITLNQRSGKIAKRKIASAGFDNPNIFFNNKEEKYTDLAVHISVDMSSSMSGVKWNQTLVSLVAIAQATSMVSGIRTQISLRFGGNVTKDSGYGEAIIINFYDSDHDKINKLKLFKFVHPSGSTPEGLCFAALEKKIMKNLINKHLLFINFSDGAPTFSGLKIKRIIKITKTFIDNIRKKGGSVLSYFISYDNESGSSNERYQFTEMYGKDAEFVNINSMVQLTKTINKKFLELGKQ